MYVKYCFAIVGLLVLLSIPACSPGGLGGMNFFSLEDDIRLGREVSAQIESDSKQFPILPERGNEEVYRYIRGITSDILNSGKVRNKDNFAWQVKIIDDPKTLNAFATPGGYIYVYTGLIKFLDTEDQLAGVMGHEIAHADLRHSTRQMSRIYGVQALLSIATKNADPGLLEQVATSLLSLKFSRGHENESDEYSVVYLCGTKHNAAGAAGFFKKIEGSSAPPEFLSTHPSSANRVKNIEQKALSLGCSTSDVKSGEYDRIKQLLR